MDGTETGRIIPFPQARARPSSQGQERLAAALVSLETALAEQRAAVRSFRASLGALGTAVGTLEAGVTGYAERLETLKGEVEGVNGAARALEAWANGVLARAR